MEKEKTTILGKQYPDQKVIARSCTVSRNAKNLEFILVETEFGEWVVEFIYYDVHAEFTGKIVGGNPHTLPAKHYHALRRKAIREMKNAEPLIGEKIAQWINE